MESSVTQPKKISRRGFLCVGAAAAASVCTGCSLFHSRKADVVANPDAGEIRLSREQSAGLLESPGSLLIRPRGMRDKILVIHSRDGPLHAVSAVCTHLGLTVDYHKDVNHLVCPCHGSEYTLHGSNMKGPAKRPLKRYPVRTEDGQVVIAV
jgi:Rieske Fe-S protein